AVCSTLFPNKSRLLLTPRLRFDPGDGINAAGRKKNEFTTPLACFFQAVVSANKIRLEQVIGPTVLACEHGRFGRTFNEIIEGASWKTVSIPNVAPVKFDPSLLQTRQIQLGPPPAELVKASDS